MKDIIDKFDNLPTTKQWLMLLKDKNNDCSDYRLAKILGITQQGMSGLMLGKSVMSDETALKVAKELEVPPLLLVMSAIRERTKSQEIIDILDTIPSEIFKASCYILTGFCLSIHYVTPLLS